MPLKIVPHLQSARSIDELAAHYGPLGGTVSMGGEGFIVRLPLQRRIHFYVYDVNRPTGYHLYTFASEGYYDEHSPLWLDVQTV